MKKINLAFQREFQYDLEIKTFKDKEKLKVALVREHLTTCETVEFFLKAYPKWIYHPDEEMNPDYFSEDTEEEDNFEENEILEEAKQYFMNLFVKKQFPIFYQMPEYFIPEIKQQQQSYNSGNE